MYFGFGFVWMDSDFYAVDGCEPIRHNQLPSSTGGGDMWLCVVYPFL